MKKVRILTPTAIRGCEYPESAPAAGLAGARGRLKVFGVYPRGMRAATAEALRAEERELGETRWSDALSSLGEPREWGGVRFGSRLVEGYEPERRLRLAAATPRDHGRAASRGAGATATAQ